MNFQTNEENLTFDDYVATSQASSDSLTKLDVVKMEFIGADLMTWQDLFEGFDEIRAITFSSGINFVYRLLKMFNKAEIIFGCEGVMSYGLKDIMAYQTKLIEKMQTNAAKSKLDLIDRIEEGSVRFYAARKKLSHEKIYLLSAEDGRKRVITGSANMSFNAFSGIQRENICYIDGEKAYNWYLDKFEDLKENSTDDISVKAIKSENLTENIEDLPISQTIKVKGAMIIEESKDLTEEVNFVIDTQNLSTKLAPNLPKPDKKGMLKIAYENIITTKRKINNQIKQEKELRGENPEFIIDVTNESAVLNGTKLDLNPDKEDIQNDVSQFINYMAGFERFHGDVKALQSRYFEFANWFFCSPFMASIRDAAARSNQNRLAYPVFGLLYGQSKAGKTSFLETLLIMMIGQKPKMMASEFTRKSIEAIKCSVKGAPVIVDDLTQTRFSQHAIETIKTDDFGVREHMVNYPAVVISANEDVKAVSPEVVRRTVICRVEAGLTNTEVMKSSLVRQVQKRIGTAFYHEYLRRMFDVVSEAIEQLKDEDSTEVPDILKSSSEIICDIIGEYADTDSLNYVRPLTIEEYFGEKKTGKHAIDVIQEAWKHNKKSFSVDKQHGELRYNAGATYEAERLLKEIPETLEAHKTREWITMNLDEATTYFDIDFTKRFSLFK